MWLKKDSGGTTITWQGRDYRWPADGAACEVPQALGEELLGIRGGGYSETSAPPKPAPAASKAAAAAKT